MAIWMFPYKCHQVSSVLITQNTLLPQPKNLPSSLVQMRKKRFISAPKGREGLCENFAKSKSALCETISLLSDASFNFPTTTHPTGSDRE